MVHYHSVFADSGNTGAQLVLGIFYLHGMGGVERNFQVGPPLLLEFGLKVKMHHASCVWYGMKTVELPC